MKNISFLKHFSLDNKIPEKPIHAEPGDEAKKKSSVLKDDLEKGAAEHSLGSEVKAKMLFSILCQ